METRSWGSRSLATGFGIACVVLGVVLATRPFTSLTVLTWLVAAALAASGVVELTGADESVRPALARIVGVTWLVLALVVAFWPDLSIGSIAVVVGIAMVVGGIARVVGALRGTLDARLTAAVGGLASIVFGALALAWPDVTLLVVAVVFGARTVLFGLVTLIGAWWRPERPDPGAAVRPSRLRRLGRFAGAVVALVIAVGLASVSAGLRRGEPVVDAFYETPSDVPDEPGRLLRAEPYTGEGVPADASAWRILYTTTRDEGEPATGSGLVIAPRSGTPSPVIAWTHGTTGVDETCAPSLLDAGLGSGAFFLLDEVLAQGWALVATDYVGLGTPGPHPYLIGQGEGRSALDAVRAARELDDVLLADDTVVWGHSQGGHAALWTAQLAPSYAPEVEIAGVAALAPASDLIGLADNLPNVPGGSVFATYMVVPYSEVYDDVRLEDYVVPAGLTIVRETAERCLAEPAVFTSILTNVAVGNDLFEQELTSGPLAERLRENIPTGPFEMPVLIGQGLDDPLVVPAVQEAFASGICDAAPSVEFRTYEGRDHVQLVEEDSALVPDLLAWTVDRLAGAPSDSTC